MLSEATVRITRGVCRHLRAHGLAVLPEMVLANHRRADVVGVDARGAITLVEVKSGHPDFAADRKWTDYLTYTDRFFFAVDEAFDRGRLPDAVGILIADGFDAEVVREPEPTPPLTAARRKAMLITFARQAALRLQSQVDPEASLNWPG
ncbi:MAG: MmcB family DNA repair protein [Geminicoccaceae bacterium]